jgi:VWFA-related protein
MAMARINGAQQLFCVMCFALGAWPAALATQDVPSSSPIPIFRAGVELVRLDIRVLGAGGRPVADIARHEIEIRENGILRPVVLLQRIDAPSYVDAARDTITGEVSKNVGAPRGHLYVLVFDTLHIAPGNETRVRVALDRFLRTRMEPGDRAALFALPGPGPQVGFTADVSRLIATLPNVRGRLTRDANSPLGNIAAAEARRIALGDPTVLQQTMQRLERERAGGDIRTGREAGRAGGGTGEGATVTERILKENARTLVERQDQEARYFLSMLADVMRDLSGIEGRKSVLLFSEGFFLQNVTGAVERVAAMAARASAVVYAFDLNQRAALTNRTGDESVEAGSEIQERLTSLSSLALETDGEVFEDATAHCDRALDTLASQAGDYYVVGFQPATTGDEARDRYHRVEVRVRRPGVRVSSRTGYTPAAAPTPADRRRSIDRALAAPFTQQGLTLEYTTYVLRGTAPDSQRVLLSLQAGLPVASTKPARTADVVFVVRNARDGRVAASGTDTIALPASARPGEATGVGGWQVQFELPSGNYFMRAVVREPGGLLGSADRRFAVPALNGPSITVSDLILHTPNEGSLPVRTIAGTSQVLVGMLDIYARAEPQLADTSVRLELLPIGGTSAVVAVHGIVEKAKVTPVGVSRSGHVELPLEAVQPGVYLARATVIAHNEVVAERSREVEVKSDRSE